MLSQSGMTGTKKISHALSLAMHSMQTVDEIVFKFLACINTIYSPEGGMNKHVQMSRGPKGHSSQITFVFYP
jgi:hypothetical protein